MNKTSYRFYWLIVSYGLLIFVPDMSVADSCRVTCVANEYNSGETCQGPLGGGYMCKPCPTKFPYKDSGNGGISSCYVAKSCEQTNCRLYNNGTSDCTGSHPEYVNNSLTCLSQTRACSDFELSSALDITLAGNNVGQWQKSDQIGEAVWNGNVWVSDGCRLQRTVQNIATSHPAECAEGVVWRNTSEFVWNATRGGYLVDYTGSLDWYYCTKCGAGKLPVILSYTDAFDLWSCWRSDGTNPYLACSCENVANGFYSTGCTISYPLNSPSIPVGCKCGSNTGLVPSSDGNSCVPDGTEYCDGIGCFTLGTSVCN